MFKLILGVVIGMFIWAMAHNANIPTKAKITTTKKTAETLNTEISQDIDSLLAKIKQYEVIK